MVLSNDLIMLKNPNDISADIYDIISHPFKNPTLTNQELSLIGFLKENSKKVKILDIGVGTGRHLIPLAELDYDVTGLDSSSEMIKNAKQKTEGSQLKVKLYQKDIYKFQTSEKYDLIILMWNSFNEIALTKTKALQLLRKLNNMLKDDGLILINIDDATKVSPSNFDFQTEVIRDGLTYHLNWKTYKYNKKTNTAISQEEVTILDKHKELKKISTAYIKQRYWNLNEIEDLVQKTKLHLLIKHIKGNNELYLIISPQG